MSSEGSWVKLNLQKKYNYYYNTDSKEGSWVPPETCLFKESWLTAEEIEVGWCLKENYKNCIKRNVIAGLVFIMEVMEETNQFI